MTGPVLRIEGAALRAGSTRLLGPLDLEVEGRGLTMIMGPNGAGKSLFLRLAQGLLRPSAGRVTWDGAPAHASMARRGFMFQAAPVMRRSVAANVAFPLQAAGVSGAPMKAKVTAILEETRLADKARMPAAQLSGGERQRMALARALVTDPQVLLMDEPSASLDPASTKALEGLIGQVVGRGTPVLMSTHDIAQARRLADRVLFFDAGVLADAAPRDSFFAAPASDAARRYLEGRL